MAINEHPCANGLTPECFAAFPEWAKLAFCYKLLHVLIPANISKRLPKGLFPGRIGPGAILPAGWDPPPGVVVPPGYTVPERWIPFTYFILPEGMTWEQVFPPGWTAGDPLPPGVTIDAGVVFPVGWSAGDALPAGVTISPGAVFPPGWTPGDPLPPGVTIDAGAIVPAGWSPTNPPPNWFVPGGTPGPAIPPGGVLPPLYLAPWEPGPVHRPYPSPAGGLSIWFSDFFTDLSNWNIVTYSDASITIVDGKARLYANNAIGGAWARMERTETREWPSTFRVLWPFENERTPKYHSLWIYTGTYRVRLQLYLSNRLVYLDNVSTKTINIDDFTSGLNLFEVRVDGDQAEIYQNGELKVSFTLPASTSLPGYWELHENNSSISLLDYIMILA